VEYPEEWAEDEEDLGGFGNPLGFWEGDCFRLEQFTAEPSTWQEGDVEVAQTMGTLDLVYYLPEEDAHATPDFFAVEIAAFRTKVTHHTGSLGKNSRAELGPLTGSLLHAVRPRFSVWRLLRENGQTCIHLHLAKLDHRPWKSLWAAGYSGFTQGKRSRFAWQLHREQKPDPYEHKQPYTVPHETPPPRVETDYRLDPVALCVGMDDVEEFDDHVILRLHFDRRELDRLESFLPLEDVLTADVQERRLRVFLRVSGDEEGRQELDIFEGDLQGRCVPEMTAWQFVRAAKGNPNGKGEAFNPALEFALAKHPEDQEKRWGRLFSARTHAEELAAERAKSKDKTYRRCEAQLSARLEELLGPSAGRGAAPPVASEQTLSPARPPAARPASVAAAIAAAAEEAPREFLVDNSELQASTKGLGYRLSKHLHDKDGAELAEWGTLVLGIDQGDGWVKVGRRYLPTKLNGKNVITGDIIGLPRPDAPRYV